MILFGRKRKYIILYIDTFASTLFTNHTANTQFPSTQYYAKLVEHRVWWLSSIYAHGDKIQTFDWINFEWKSKIKEMKQ